MSALKIFEGARRARAFLAAFFPALDRVFAPVRAAAARMAAHPLIAKPRAYLRNSTLGRAVVDFLGQAYWADYSKDAIDTSRLPREAIAVLRPVFLTAVLLCVLIPLAMEWPHPSVVLSGPDGAQSPAPVWSVLLWLLALALAWGCLLLGALLSNRAALAATAVLYVWFMGFAATSLPRSPWNALPSLVVLVAIAALEFRRYRRATRDGATGVLFALPAGMAAGVALIALTPLAPLVHGWVLAAGLVLGAVLGLLACACGRWLRQRGEQGTGDTPAFGWFLAFTALSLLHLAALVLRGGLVPQGEAALDFLRVWTGYLWPLYYFVGAGVVFKVLGRADDVVRIAESLVPSRYFVPLAVLALLTLALFVWLPYPVNFPAFPWPAWVGALAAWSYGLGGSWMWSDPVLATTVEWLRWVMLFDVVAIAFLLARRRLDGRAVGRLVFWTLLAALGVHQYMAQYTGFARGGAPSAVVVLTFALGIFWAIHKSALAWLARSSGHWPRTGRLAIFGALLLFVLLSLHARAAVHDPRVMDEILLYFFNGLIGIGIPYYLYLYATRSLGQLPISLGRLLAAFGIGAALALLMTALDKLASAGWSARALWSALEEERRQLVVEGILRTDIPALGAPWIALRGAVVIAVLALLPRVGGTLLRAGRRLDSAETVFVLMAATTGFVSFSLMRVDFPLVPLRAALLVTPDYTPQAIELGLVATFLAYGIPALILALASRESAGAALRAASIGLAYACYLGVAMTWPAKEPWLRSSGLVSTAGTGTLVLFGMLLLAARSRVLETVGGGARSGGSPYVATRTVVRLGAACVAALVAASLYRIVDSRSVERAIPGVAVPVPVPARWKPAPSSGGGAAFARSSFQVQPARLFIEHVDAAGATTSPQQALDAFLGDATAQLRNVSATALESWDRRYPGARIADWSWEQSLPGGNTLLMMGSRLILPRPDGAWIVVTLTAVFDDWLERRWDLARIAAELADAEALAVAEVAR